MNSLPFSIKTFSLLFVAVTLASCYDGSPDPYIVTDSRQKENFYYIPFSSNTPLSKNKREVNIRLQSSVNSKHTGVEAQVAFTPVKNVGITAGYASGESSHAFGSPFILYEGGAGYYYPFGQRWHFETYAGAGTQKLDNQHHTGKSSVKNQYFFIQPAAVFQNEKGTVRLALASRLVQLNNKIISMNFYADREPFVANQFKNMAAHKNHTYLEPGLTFQFGWHRFLFHTGYTYATELSKVKMYHVNSKISTGIQLRLGGKQ